MNRSSVFEMATARRFGCGTARCLSRIVPIVAAFSLAADCSKRSAPTMNPGGRADVPFASTATTQFGLRDPQWALASLIARPPPPDGTYLADAIIAGVNVCECPPPGPCNCPPGIVSVTHDFADSMSWQIRTSRSLDLGRLIRTGMRCRLTVSVRRGDLLITNVTSCRE
jgi:hypothetical protein